MQPSGLSKTRPISCHAATDRVSPGANVPLLDRSKSKLFFLASYNTTFNRDLYQMVLETTAVAGQVASTSIEPAL
jgi:hypothetical protein